MTAFESGFARAANAIALRRARLQSGRQRDMVFGFSR